MTLVVVHHWQGYASAYSHITAALYSRQPALLQLCVEAFTRPLLSAGDLQKSHPIWSEEGALHCP